MVETKCKSLKLLFKKNKKKTLITFLNIVCHIVLKYKTSCLSESNMPLEKVVFVLSFMRLNAVVTAGV